MNDTTVHQSAYPDQAPERCRPADRRRHMNEEVALTFKLPSAAAGEDAVTHRAHLGLGFYDDGRVAEVFVKTKDLDSMMQFIVEDACVLISQLLQRQVKPAEIAVMVGHRGNTPTTVIGAIARHVALADPESDLTAVGGDGGGAG